MKVICLMLLASLASINAQETWLEILAPKAQKAQQGLGPGIIQHDDSEAFRKHWKALQTIHKALPAAPANFPNTWDDLSINSIISATFSIRRLADHFAQTRQWDRLIALYETAGNLSKRIKASEPTLAGLLIAGSFERLAFKHLTSLLDEPDEELRRAEFSRFRAIIIKGPLTRRDFESTERAETKYSVDLSRNLPKYLASLEGFAGVLTIQWLTLESEGKNISSPEDLLAEFPVAEKQAIKQFKLHVDLKSRTITRPADPSDDDTKEKIVSIPNLLNQ